MKKNIKKFIKEFISEFFKTAVITFIILFVTISFEKYLQTTWTNDVVKVFNNNENINNN